MAENNMTTIQQTQTTGLVGNPELKASQEGTAEALAAKKQDYKTLLRKKILIGSCYLKQAKTPERLAALKADLNDYLKRASDRALFDLPSHNQTLS